MLLLSINALLAALTSNPINKHLHYKHSAFLETYATTLSQQILSLVSTLLKAALLSDLIPQTRLFRRHTDIFPRISSSDILHLKTMTRGATWPIEHRVVLMCWSSRGFTRHAIAAIMGLKVDYARPFRSIGDVQIGLHEMLANRPRARQIFQPATLLWAPYYADQWIAGTGLTANQISYLTTLSPDELESLMPTEPNPLRLQAILARQNWGPQDRVRSGELCRRNIVHYPQFEPPTAAQPYNDLPIPPADYQLARILQAFSTPTLLELSGSSGSSRADIDEARASAGLEPINDADAADAADILLGMGQ